MQRQGYKLDVAVGEWEFTKEHLGLASEMF